ncbi:MAG TPA: MarR family winged helix-turn-helix transcriptional regulator [Rudaea sp.]|nr:MarR family winged helix-turn-helix transcriptional regulator [Rudaea sp.]
MKRQPTCICVNLRRASRALSAFYDEAMAPSGITVTQFSLLRAVEREQPVAISALAADMELDRTTLARNIAPLERAGLLALAPGEDQRVTEVRLTAAGSATIRRASPLWEAVQRRIAAQLGDERIAQLREIGAAISVLSSADESDSIRAKQRRRRGSR